MAHLPYLHHGYSPQGQAKQLPWVTKSTAPVIPFETSLNPVTRAEDTNILLKKHQPVKELATLLKKIRIPQEAQRILGNSNIPVVSLERLKVQAVVLSSSLQPVVSLERLPCQADPQICCEVSPSHQNIFRAETSLKTLGLSEAFGAPILWTEQCPDGSASEEREQNFAIDCEWIPDQPYVLLDPGSEDWDPEDRAETFYLDPDPEQSMVIQLDPDVQTDQDLDADIVQEHDGEDQTIEELKLTTDHSGHGPDVEELYESPPRLELDGPGPEEANGPETKEVDGGAKPDRWLEVESDDFCAVCLNGGDLLCCDRCPRVYHLSCHLPSLTSFPQGDWACTLCRTDRDPADAYERENVHSCRGARAPYTLSRQEQRRCENLALQLYSHALSAPFHEPVSPLAQNYYQIIKRPIDLSVVRRKLDRSNALPYFSVEQFIDDVLLMFNNCATFNYPDSEVAQAGQNLEKFFLDQLKAAFPERTFPNATLETMNRARLRWLRKKESQRRKRCSSRGHRYYLM